MNKLIYLNNTIFNNPYLEENMMLWKSIIIL